MTTAIAQAKLCNACAHPNAPAADACALCGMDLVDAEMVAAEAAAPPAPAPTPAPVATVAPAPTSTPQAQAQAPAAPVPAAPAHAPPPATRPPEYRPAARAPRHSRPTSRRILIGAGAVVAIALVAVALALRGGWGSSNASSTSGNAPVPQPPVGPGGDPAAGGGPPPGTPQPAPKPPLPAPVRVIRKYYAHLGNGEYSSAFALMTPAFQQGNPSWTSAHEAASAQINVIDISADSIGRSESFVSVDFYARDRVAVLPSDTKCREFTGSVRVLNINGRWRYDPSVPLSKRTVPSSDPNCPS